MKPSEISDAKLLELCAYWGKQALFARYKFISLLPEVYRRRLYEKKGCSSIFVYAYKTAGLSEEQVRSALRLRERVEDKPALRDLFDSGTVSVNKIEKVSYIATPETDELWASRVQIASTKALETMVRDEKSLHVQTSNQQQIEVVNEPPLSLEVKQKLNDLAQKGIDINQIILDALQKRECEIAEEKEHLAEKAYAKRNEQLEQGKPVSRYVVVATKKLLKKEYGTKCGITDCHNAAIDIHHTNLFALSGDHNPKYMVPLCKPHHEIASLVNQKVIRKRMQNTVAG